MTTSTLTLTSFLLARIAEDEAAADRVEFRPYVGEGVPESLTARVLAECEAKRRIVEEHALDDVDPCTSADHMGHLSPASACPVFRTLALVYVGHPDYRDEWRP